MLPRSLSLRGMRMSIEKLGESDLDNRGLSSGMAFSHNVLSNTREVYKGDLPAVEDGHVHGGLSQALSGRRGQNPRIREASARKEATHLASGNTNNKLQNQRL